MTLNEFDAEVKKRGCFLTVYKKPRRTDDVFYYWIQLFDPAREVEASATDSNFNKCARAVLKKYDQRYGRRGTT